MSAFIFVKSISKNSNSIETESTKETTLEMNDFAVNNIRLDQIIDEAINYLGDPIEVEYIDNDDNGIDEYAYYYFEHMKLGCYLSDKMIDYILIESKNIFTYRYIEIGNSEAEVIAQYGTTNKLDSTLDYYIMKDNPNDDLFRNKYSINFTIEDGLVSKILIYVVPEI